MCYNFFHETVFSFLRKLASGLPPLSGPTLTFGVAGFGQPRGTKQTRPRRSPLSVVSQGQGQNHHRRSQSGAISLASISHRQSEKSPQNPGPHATTHPATNVEN